MIYADITELAGNPVRSGIQRVVREFLGRWSGPEPLKACVFSKTAIDLVELPDEAVNLLTERDPATKLLSSEEIARRVHAILASAPLKPVPHRGCHIVIPELFFDPLRAHHLTWRKNLSGGRLSMLFYDFIPWLYPDRIGVERAGPLMSYLKLAMETDTPPAFISGQTYDDWRLRILRAPRKPGVVLPLGADGLGLERQRFDPAKRSIVCLGSIDGRKNQDLLAKAFARVSAAGLDLDLVLVGYAFDKEGKPAREIRRQMEACPRIRHIQNATDADVLEILRSARATVYLSPLEGYGLPPVESLHAGIPVIVADGIPSIARLPTAGQIRISTLDQSAVEDALTTIADDSATARLWAGAATLDLPTWAGFATSAHKWLAH